MKARFLLAVALLTVALPARPSPSQARPSPPPAPACDQCADLPSLYRELLEQEYLRNRFEQWIKEQYYPISVAEMKRIAVRDLSLAMKESLYGVLAPPKGAGGTGAPSAAPAYGTNMSTNSCQLVEYVHEKDAKGNDVKDENGEPKVIEKPITPQQVRDKLCGPIAEAVLAHEKHHQDSCRAAWAKGESQKLDTVKFFVEDDRDAYQAGIAVLRERIAALAGACSWAGSARKIKPDGTKTVPTPDQITTLKTHQRAALLKRSTR